MFSDASNSNARTAAAAMSAQKRVSLLESLISISLGDAFTRARDGRLLQRPSACRTSRHNRSE